jgi:hypothetical protein
MHVCIYVSSIIPSQKCHITIGKVLKVTSYYFLNVKE